LDCVFAQTEIPRARVGRFKILLWLVSASDTVDHRSLTPNFSRGPRLTPARLLGVRHLKGASV